MISVKGKKKHNKKKEEKMTNAPKNETESNIMNIEDFTKLIDGNDNYAAVEVKEDIGKLPENEKEIAEVTNTEEVEKDSVDTTEEKEIPNKPELTEEQKFMALGNINSYAYFYVNLTNDGPNADIISLAVVTHDGKSFYAEFTDFDMSKLSMDSFEAVKALKRVTTCTTDPNHWTVSDNREKIGGHLLDFLNKNFGEKKYNVVFVGDLLHYQFMELLRLLSIKDDFNTIPQWIVQYPMDITYDLESVLSITPDQFNDSNMKTFTPHTVACAISRNALLNNYIIDNHYAEMKVEDKNALFEAKKIRLIHQTIWGVYKDEILI